MMMDGVFRGAVATGALSAFERLASRRLGKPPVFAPEQIAMRLGVPPGRARGIGRLMRWGYGPALGMVFRRLPARWMLGPWGGLAVGLGVFLFEAFALPRMGATPRLKKWRRSELVMLLAQTLAFGKTFSSLRPRRA